MNEGKDPSWSAQAPKDNAQQLENKIDLLPWEPKMTTFVGLRLAISTCMNSFTYIFTTAETTLAKRSMQRCFMLLGESQKFQGYPSPYVNSESPANALISRLADESYESFAIRWEKLDSHLARVKDMRGLIEKIVQALGLYRTADREPVADEYNDCLKNAYFALKEAKGWLGWELDRIRNVINQENQTAVNISTLKLH